MRAPGSRFLLAILLAAFTFSSAGCALLKKGTSSSKDDVTLSSGGDTATPEPRPRAGGVTSTKKEASKPATAKPASSFEDDLIPATAYKLKPGDPVVIMLRGILPKDDQIEDIIDEQGYVNLPYIGSIRAAGRTSSQLEQEVEREYLAKKIYKTITVNVVMPSQSYFVRGEVRQPGRFGLITGVTLVQAIATAGGYTDFADPTKVKLIRGEASILHNARDFEKFPERDLQIEPGDVIVVPRSIF